MFRVPSHEQEVVLLADVMAVAADVLVSGWQTIGCACVASSEEGLFRQRSGNLEPIDCYSWGGLADGHGSRSIALRASVSPRFTIECGCASPALTAVRHKWGWDK